jgi:hypothetical protein
VQVEALEVVVNVPVGQLAHRRSAVALGVAAAKVPGTQSVHDVHVAALEVAENAPLAQAAQERSAVAVPASATDWPATHAVIATQAVAGSES